MKDENKKIIEILKLGSDKLINKINYYESLPYHLPHDVIKKYINLSIDNDEKDIIENHLIYCKKCSEIFSYYKKISLQKKREPFHEIIAFKIKSKIINFKVDKREKIEQIIFAKKVHPTFDLYANAVGIIEPDLAKIKEVLTNVICQLNRHKTIDENKFWSIVFDEIMLHNLNTHYNNKIKKLINNIVKDYAE